MVKIIRISYKPDDPIFSEGVTISFPKKPSQSLSTSKKNTAGQTTKRGNLKQKKLFNLLLEGLNIILWLVLIIWLIYDSGYLFNKSLWMLLFWCLFLLFIPTGIEFIKQKFKPKKKPTVNFYPKQKQNLDASIASNLWGFGLISFILWMLYALGIYGSMYLWLAVLCPASLLIAGLAGRFENKSKKESCIKKSNNFEWEQEELSINPQPKVKEEMTWDEAIEELNQWAKDRGEYLEPLPMGTTQVIFRPANPKTPKKEENK